ncbi:hypothetical protein BEL04_13565 [Mucilaginibacter sp. PPCGB 2223]|uniref:hypothetical protein n=1 Tax=Mucilaginibacter sp. PPCGB 2223 TaxID=1886027 RepID=UPI00082693B0|nr:hypothetical protein [Mucilaginibacter sp. PPCGB 2223]OCX52485.1 hypothetical protein BEL04_13565 [Mucilaginibacter sp. PPCGB 2223]
MSTITLKGSFDTPGTNGVLIEVYHPNPNGYDYKKDFDDDFNVTLTDLKAGETYYVDLSGSTTSKFTLVIDGDIDGSISLPYTGFFIDGFTFSTL